MLEKIKYTCMNCGKEIGYYSDVANSSERKAILKAQKEKLCQMCYLNKKYRRLKK